jgi:hypothetical protein
MRAELVQHSMFLNTPIYNVGGEIVPGLRRPAVLKDTSDTVYTVPLAGAHRLDLISQLFYGTPALWWLIAEVNDIVDPLAEVAPGRVLRVPARERLSKEGVLNG